MLGFFLLIGRVEASDDALLHENFAWCNHLMLVSLIYSGLDSIKVE